jgi:hypothetical protein
LDTPFHPYYYDYSKCPYSYYKISEEGMCFNELENNTIDPLKFLETNGSILNNYKVTGSYTSTNSSSNTSSSSNNDIFNKTVYI